MNIQCKHCSKIGLGTGVVCSSCEIPQENSSVVGSMLDVLRTTKVRLAVIIGIILLPLVAGRYLWRKIFQHRKLNINARAAAEFSFNTERAEDKLNARKKV